MRARKGWAALGVAQRCEYFSGRWAAQIAGHAEDLARIEALDSGATVNAMRSDVLGTLLDSSTFIPGSRLS